MGELIKVLEEDMPFYWRSGGGITVSGGEPLLQAGFVAELLRECRSCGLHTGIETTGYAEWADLEEVCKYADIVLYDLKHIDSATHRILTGVPNEPILHNLQQLSNAFPSISITVRTPIVPGLTDDEGNIRGIATFLSALPNIKAYELLPYHAFGEPKYGQLGREYPARGLRPPTEERMGQLRRIAEEFIG